MAKHIHIIKDIRIIFRISEIELELIYLKIYCELELPLEVTPDTWVYPFCVDIGLVLKLTLYPTDEIIYRTYENTKRW